MTERRLMRQSDVYKAHEQMRAIGLGKKDILRIQPYYEQRNFGTPEMIWDRRKEVILKSRLPNDHALRQSINRYFRPWPWRRDIDIDEVDNLSIRMYSAGIFPPEEIDYVLRLPVSDELIQAQQYVAQIYSPLGFVMKPQSFGQLGNQTQDHLIQDLRILYQEAYNKVYPRRKKGQSSYMIPNSEYELMYFTEDHALIYPIQTRYSDLIATGSLGYHAHRQSLQLNGHFVGPHTAMNPWDPQTIQKSMREDIEGDHAQDY